LWLLECGAVKQWEMPTSLLCADCLPANQVFQNRKSGWSKRLFFSFSKLRSTTIRQILQKQLQTALILSVSLSFDFIRESASTAFDKVLPLVWSTQTIESFKLSRPRLHYNVYD
jgi:hypothetical protein